LVSPDGHDFGVDVAAIRAGQRLARRQQELPMDPISATHGRIGVVSDAICPWCWIGKRQLDLALLTLAERGLTFDVSWRPFQLNPDMPPAGVDRDDYRARKFGSLAESRAADARVAEAGAAIGLEFRHDLMRRTPNTVDAHRVIRFAGRLGVQSAVVEALFHGYFTAGADLGDHGTLVALAGAAGLDPAATTRLLAGDEERREVLEEDEAARRNGLDAVPAFLIGNYVLFSGAVPAEAMTEAFTKAWKVLGPQSG
jgi:predicted DsbA family dithiol-disulfide isomerase